MPLPFRNSSGKSAPAPVQDDVDDKDDYDNGNRNIILSLIGQLRPGSDLSRITLPTFILERKSMLERITNLLQHPTIMAKAAENPDPVQRFVDVVRWYMSGWHIAPKAVKKPLNPVLGEYFSCYWEMEDQSRAYYIAEQTSHHAPKSSFFFTYPAHKIRVDGIVIPKSRFLGNSAASIMEGVSKMTFGKHVNQQGEPEVYEVTQPNIYARNILVGSLKLEMGDKAIVKCANLDMECCIEFKVKGYISGTYNEVKGTIKRAGKPLYEITGKWNEVMYIKDLKTGKKTVFFDTTKDVFERPLVRAISEQGPMESRRLWQKVCAALGERNQKVATDEKFLIEDQQRQLQKQRNEGREPPFQPKIFAPTDENFEFKIFADKLIEQAQTDAETEEVLGLVMPVLPGQQFPPDFDGAAADKAAIIARNAPKSEAKVSRGYKFEGDVFVDAPGA